MQTSFWKRLWKRFDQGIPDLMPTYFVSMLEVRLQRAKRTKDDTTRGIKTSVVSEICAGLNKLKDKSPTAASVEGDRDWIEAARLERLLVLIEPKDCLLDEVKSRGAEALDEKLSYAPRFQTSFEIRVGWLGELRSVLWARSRAKPGAANP